MHWAAAEVEKGADADTTLRVDRQGIAAEYMKIVNGEGEETADGNMVENSDGNMVEDNNDAADGSAGSTAKFEDAHEEIALEDQ